MKFEHIEQFEKYLLENNLDISKLEIEVFSSVAKMDTGVSHIIIESFSDSPSFPVEVVETDHNIIYVNECDAMKDCCSTGKLTIADRTIFMNICESDNSVHINLNITVNDKKWYNVPFLVEKLDINTLEPKVQISKKLI